MILIRPLTLALLMISVALFTVSDARAEDLGAFEGAIWRFKMTPKNPKLGELVGAFRVNHKVIYQKVNPIPKSTDEKVAGNEVYVGAKTRDGAKRTRLNFTDLRAFTPKNGFNGKPSATDGIKGTVLMKMDKAGKWSGILIDGDGRHWTFSCMRVRE